MGFVWKGIHQWSLLLWVPGQRVLVLGFRRIPEREEQWATGMKVLLVLVAVVLPPGLVEEKRWREEPPSHPFSSTPTPLRPFCLVQLPRHLSSWPSLVVFVTAQPIIFKPLEFL